MWFDIWMSKKIFALLVKIREDLSYVSNKLAPRAPIKRRSIVVVSTIAPLVQGNFWHILIYQEPLRFLCTETNQFHQIDMMDAADCLNLC